MSSYQLPNISGEPGYEEIAAALEPAGPELPVGSRRALFGDVCLSSHFQPIYSLSHRRIVGHEALMRGTNKDGVRIPPPELLAQANSNYSTLLFLDRLARANHIHNFAAQPDAEGWLFLNMSPQVFLQGPRLQSGRLVDSLMYATGLTPERIVIEVLEEAVQDNTCFKEAVAFFRSLGFLIALDDFGAGHSNFDRVWNIRPDIVKLDRSLIVQAVRDPKIRYTLPQIASLLHQVGIMVLLEGVETAEEAYIALESDMDFVQGYYFGLPAPNISSVVCPEINSLWEDYDARWLKDKRDYHEKIAPYFNALGYASVLLSVGRPIEEACRSFLELANSTFCYLLDDKGQQIGVNVWSSNAGPNEDKRFTPLANTRGARWSRRPYFRRAVESFGKVQVTRPYLSISSASLCITLSCSFKVNDELRVICGDVQLEQQ